MPPKPQTPSEAPKPPSDDSEKSGQGAQQAAPQPGPVQIPPQVLAQMMGQRVMLPPGFPMAVGGIPVAQAQLQVWQGQYPPPDAIERYEAVLSGSFDRMIVMAERLQAAQIAESSRVIDYTHAESRRGHWLGAGTMVVAMACALIALALGNGWVAGAFLTVPVMGVAKALVDSAKARALPELPLQSPNPPSPTPNAATASPQPPHRPH